jgi:DNA primase
MTLFKRESLELLKSRIDLAEVISSHIKVNRAGAAYKALCPFHDEKTPSFTIQKGDSHYHCFGCGAHGDAIQFLMQHLRMSFVEAVESLADRFGVFLEEGNSEPAGPNKKRLKETLEKAVQFYHFYLLHTEEGHEGLQYLYKRGIDLEFIRAFSFGFAPKAPFFLQKVLREQGFKEHELQEAGLVKIDSSGKKRDFFSERIVIPIHDAAGAPVGFTARKIHEDAFGPKYINTAETPLFKKSRILFGLSYSRKRIAKERKAILVEGQIDALRLIHAGFTYTVASQGTAFTEEHAHELIHLGVKEVLLAFDPDNAGQEAAVKVGDIFQKEGIEVSVLPLPEKMDPDAILRDKGPEFFQEILQKGEDYLTFIVKKFSQKLSLQSPAQKNELIKEISGRIRCWDHPLMVHESLKKLAKLTQTPEAMITVTEEVIPTVIRTHASISHSEVDPDRVLEADLLRWLFLFGEGKPQLVKLALKNLQSEHFRLTPAKRLFTQYAKSWEQGLPKDVLSFSIGLENAEEQLFLSEMLQKRVNPEKAEECLTETIQKMLDRFWLSEREEIKTRILSGSSSQEEVMNLAKRFDEIKRQRPKVVQPDS